MRIMRSNVLNIRKVKIPTSKDEEMEIVMTSKVDKKSRRIIKPLDLINQTKVIEKWYSNAFVS